MISHLLRLAGLTTVLILGGCTSSSASDSTPADWVSTSINAWSVAISYPPGWEAISLPELSLVNIREPEGLGDLVIWEMSYAAAEGLGLSVGPGNSGQDYLQRMIGGKAIAPGYEWEFGETEVMLTPAGKAFIAEAFSAPLAARTYLAVLPLEDRVLTFEVRLQLDRNWGYYQPIYEQIIRSVSPITDYEVTF